jgi:hypothetical protein
MLDRQEEATALVGRLTEGEIPADDLTIVLIGLAYLNESESIKRIFDQQVSGGHRPSPIEYHLAATAEARLGNLKTAQRFWHRARNRDPELAIAEANLEDVRASPEERNGVCYIDYGDWIPPVLRSRLTESLESHQQVGAVVEDVRVSLLRDAPWLPKAVPVLLREGDQRTRAFALFVAFASEDTRARETAMEFLLREEGLASFRGEFIHGLIQADALPHGTRPETGPPAEGKTF